MWVSLRVLEFSAFANFAFQALTFLSAIIFHDKVSLFSIQDNDELWYAGNDGDTIRQD